MLYAPKNYRKPNVQKVTPLYQVYQIYVPTLSTSEVVSGFINVGDLCLAKDHICHNVALESPTSGQNNTIKYYLTTAFSNSGKHNLSFLYCGLSQDESTLQSKVGEGGGVGWDESCITFSVIEFSFVHIVFPLWM
jgi:hypothetical protein